MGKKSHLFILATADEIELTVCVGTRNEVASFLGCHPDSLDYNSKTGAKIQGKYLLYKMEREGKEHDEPS
jgi:hypothetical protein